jgi:cell division protein ZapA
VESYNKVQVAIGGETVTFVSNEDEEYVRKLASYIDGKIQELSGAKNLHPVTKCLVAAINLADELFKERGRPPEESTTADRLEIERLKSANEELVKKLDDAGDELFLTQDELSISRNCLEMSKSELANIKAELKKAKEDLEAQLLQIGQKDQEISQKDLDLAELKEYNALLEADLEEAKRTSSSPIKADERRKPYVAAKSR